MNISIEGIIGAGKSTILQLLQERSLGHIEIIKEPIEVWEAGNIIENFYTNPHKHAFELQKIVLSSFKSTKNNQSIVIQERSPFTSYYIFATLHHQLAYTTKSQFKSLSISLKKAIANSNHLNLIIYLEVETDKAMDRIKQRNRPGEKSISFNYLTDLQLLHHNLYVCQKDKFNIPIVVIDANKELLEVVKDVEEIIEQHKQTVNSQKSSLELKIKISKDQKLYWE